MSQSLPCRLRTANPTSLVGILALLFFLFSSTTIFLIYGQFQNTLAKSELADGIVARMTSKLLEEHEENVVATLKAYAARHLLIDSMQRRDVVEIHRHLAELKSSTDEIDLTFVTDDKGLLWANYPEFPEAIGRNLADRDWFKGVSSTWQPYVSSVFQLIVGDKPLAIAAAAPIFDPQGQAVGILAVSNRLATIEALLDNSLQNGVVYVLDRTGSIIYDSRQHGLRQILAYPLLTEVRHILESGQKNGEISDQHDGRKKKFLAVAQNEIGWTVVVERTMGETLRHDYMRYIRTAGISALCFLLIVGSFLYQRSLHDKTLSLLELERQLRQRELIYKKLIDTVPGIVYSFSEGCADVYYSPRVQDILDYSPDQLNHSRLWYHSIHPDHAAQIDQAIAEVKISGKAELEYIIYDRHGRARWLSDRMTSSVNYDGETVITGIASDITDRKNIEDALSKSRGKYQSLVENMLDGFACCRLLYDEQGRAGDFVYLEVNNAFTQLTGIQDVVGKKYSEIFPDSLEENRELLQCYARVAATGCPEKFEYHFKPISLWLEISVTSCEQGCILVIFSDVTERKQAEELLRTLNDALERRVEQRTRELQETQAQYLHAEKLSAIGKLSASIAHEFNSPLMAVLIILKGLRQTAKLAEEERQLLQSAIEAGERMKNLMISLRDFNRPSMGQKVLTDVHACLDSILLLCRSDFKKKQISTVLRYAEQLPQIVAISDQIKQVFLNLLNNAADACLENGGVITISTSFAGRRVTIAIHDNGIGIEPEKIDQIFQPFYTTKPEVKGTGLGLSVSLGIVRSHRGEIRAESRPGEGSTFTVVLPVEG